MFHFLVDGRTRPISALCIVFLLGGCDGALELGINDSGPPDGDSGGKSQPPQKGVASGFTDEGGSSFIEGGNSGFTNGSDASVDPTTCAVECEGAAANGCDLPVSTAANECVAFCANSLSQSQLSCLVATPCAPLVEALSGKETICGIIEKDGGCTPIGLGGGAGGGGSVDPTDCAVQCDGAAANGCGVPENIAVSECQTLCAKSPTQDQLTCVLANPCCAFVSALGGGPAICGL
jgi:hypothetical protein